MTLNPYDRQRLVNSISNFLPTVHAARLLGPGRRWLEVGSGIGMKSLPISGNVEHYVAVELNSDQSRQAKEYSAIYGASNISHVAANAVDVISNPSAFDLGSGVDVLLLYAVLEHLLPEERRPILELASTVLDEGGSVVVMETPNRLIPFDSHTTQLHFFNMLPDELAIEYLVRSGRSVVRDPVLVAPPESRREMLYRNGRGLSYHDFELGLGLDDTSDLPVRFDGYNVHLLNQEPLMRQEVGLQSYLTGNQLGVDASFSRSWIEFGAGHHMAGTARAPNRLTEPDSGDHVAQRSESFWTLDAFVLERECQAVFDLSSSSATSITVLLDLSSSTGETLVSDAAGCTVGSLDIQRLRSCRAPTWHEFAAVEIPVDSALVRLRCETGSTLRFYGILS